VDAPGATYERLASESGYGAGVVSPGWYEHLFTATEDPLARWFSRVAGVLREPPPAEGAGSGFCRGLEPDRYISKHRCTITGCGTAEGCVCVQTPGHRVRCAAGFDPASDCPAADECSERRPCGRGRFCAKVAKCCGDRPRRVCLRPCPA